MNLNHLNDSQKVAVDSTDGPVMILAGAGSGKTRTLVTRLQYLLEEKGISPFQMLAVTFSNKAAREMRERIAESTEYDIGALQITTFHSFCSRLLRSEATYLGLSRNFTIYDDTESKSVIKAILAKRGINQKEIHPNEVKYFISDVKNSGHYVGAKDDDLMDEIDKEDLFYDFYLEYEAELHRSNAVDFGGLIAGVLNLFDNFPEILERYQKRFKYLLVDEYQDTNRAQFKLIRLLSQAGRNICVVGDEDQSIYSWRGADIRNILDFEKIFPEFKLIKLEQNYRSSKTIIEAASYVISKNEQRKGKKMWTNNPDGEVIRIIECADDRAEASYVANEISKLVHSGVSLQDIALFYRTNSQSRMFEDELRKLKLPYRVVAGMKFYERKEIKDILAYLRVIVNSKDSLALSRIINVPVRGIGAKTLRKLEDEAIKMQVSLWEILEKLIEFPEEYKHLKLSAKVKSGLHSLVTLIQEVKLLEGDHQKPSVGYEKVLYESGYVDALKAEKNYESMARIENLEELLSGIKQYEDSNENASLVGFLENIMLDSEAESEEFDGQQLSLMTVHGSKGLEYPYVFVVGVEENVFPSYRSLEEGDETIEEERRLFYVAMTRAMQKLYITFAQGRMLWGQIKFNGPSRFLDEIPEEYFDWEFYKTDKKKKKNQSYDEFKDFDYGDDFSQISEIENQVNSHEKTFVQTRRLEDIYTYPKGSKIKHGLYGNGEVLDSEGSGNQEKVVIKFQDGAKKKFMVKFAPLELV